MIAWVPFVFAAILGLLIGSFLNVCIYRLPRGESIMWPGSHCPVCEKAIEFYDNVPLLSYLWLTGRCRACRTHISIQYPVVEAANAGGYAGSPYFRISIAGTERSLTATASGELTVLPAFTGSPEQLWRIDQLADGTYRLTPKAVPGGNLTMALSAIGGSSPTLERVDANTDRQRWLLRTP